MKKILALTLVSTLLAGGAGALAANPHTASAAENDKVIKAVAQYDFDDAANLGKDSSGNGFHLAAKDTSASTDAEKGISHGTETEGIDEISYAKFRRTCTDEGQERGGLLYAPFFKGTSEDFSDVLTGSFTVSMRFRGVDIPAGNGSYYLLHTGKYNNALGITPWNDHIEVFPVSEKGAPKDESDAYAWTQTQKYDLSASVNDVWHTVTVAGDQEKGKVDIYLDGVLAQSADLGALDAKVLLSAGDITRYTFCIGGQCEGAGGNASTMYSSADVDYVRVYDSALSAENVQKLYNGEEAVYADGAEYVTEVEKIDFSAYDFLVTDSNTVKEIKSSLPSTVKATTSSGKSKNVSVYWYETDTEIRGYLQGKTLANYNNLMYSNPYGYTVRLTYDDALITVKDVLLDGEPLAVGTDLGKISGGTLSFKIEQKKNGVTVNGFYYDDLDWERDEVYDADDDTYYMELSGPANIVIYASLKQGTVTYFDGEENLGTSKYTMGGSEELRTFEKEGYEFEGWYTDVALKNKFEALDYSDPVDITLYASYKKIGGEGKRGCAGSLAGGVSLAAGLGAVAVAAAIVWKKKKNS